MGHAGEVVASELHISREAQDAYAAESHRRADTATVNGLFQTEIVPVSSPATRKGVKIVIDKDESIRSDTSQNQLAALKPAFKNDGTVTAGNAPPVNDGASALVIMAATRATQLQLKPLARIVGQATSGLAPKYVLMTPVDAVNRLLKKIDWKIDDVDLFELNEAFAVQALAVIRELQLDPDKVNVNGGAIALGHAIGSSGARILITLLHALEQKGVNRGIATLCLGGGNGVAVAIERL
jgi:acetyl-CoA C-acetyltransferase